MHAFRRIFALIICLATLSALHALDLPVKTVKGKQYFVYTVSTQETVYGISKRLGISREEIVRHNPAAEGGVKKDMLLLFPFEEYAKLESTPIDTIAAVAPAEIAMPEVIATPTISVVLPFGLGNSEQTRENKLALDFYKGFLIGVDTLANRPGKIEINAIDCSDANSLYVGDNALKLAKSTLIIAPANEEILTAMAAKESDAYILNMFLVHDSLYMSNPRVLQANVPQKDMFRLAVDAIQSDFNGFTPVILRNISGRNEKESFTAYLTERSRETGIEPIVIEYDGTLNADQIEALPTDNGQAYMFIPTSGSLSDFNKFAYVIKAFRDKIYAAQTAAIDNGEEINPVRIEVFGYPDWVAFRGDALETLYKLEATIYSRFFDNFDSFDAKMFQEAFMRWYGTEIIQSIPSQAMLGFDAARMAIKNLRANNGAFNPTYPKTFSGIQSSLNFSNEGTAGYYDNSLYIIKYLPDNRMEARTL